MMRFTCILVCAIFDTNVHGRIWHVDRIDVLQHCMGRRVSFSVYVVEVMKQQLQNGRPDNWTILDVRSRVCSVMLIIMITA